MTIFQRIKDFLEGNKSSIDTPEAFCPNCWGHQEYEGRIKEAVRTEQIDLNNIDQKKGWIDAYATKYFEGIRLRKVKGEFLCPVCTTD